jgi:hypothetical protein
MKDFHPKEKVFMEGNGKMLLRLSNNCSAIPETICISDR